MIKINKDQMNKSKWVAALVVFILMISSVTAYATSEYQVTLEHDNKVDVVQTRSYEPKKIVEKAKIKLNTNDELDLSKFKVGEKSVIKVKRAADVEVYYGAVLQSKLNMPGTVKDAILKSKIQLRDDDSVNYKLNENLKNGMKIVVTGKDFVTILDNGKIYSCKVEGETLEQILNKLQISINENDETSVPLASVLEKGSTVEIYRVEYKTRTVVETIKYKTVNVDDNKGYIGHKKVITEGKDGSQENTYKDKYVNGKLSKSTLTNSKLIKKPVNKVIGHGTRVHVKGRKNQISKKALPSRYSLSSDGIPTDYLTMISGGSTAYTCNTSSYRGSGRTSTGARAQSGLVAVNPKQIPYGTEMYIVSADGKKVYGYAIAADTGGFARKGSTVVDLYMDSASECYQWGRQKVCIYILRWGK